MAKKLCDFGLFSCFFNVLVGGYGVLIIPQWLIKVPGHIPILFGWFWELSNFSIFWTCSWPSLPVFLMKILENTRKNQGTSLENMDFGNLRPQFFRNFRKSCVPDFGIFVISNFEDLKFWRSEFLIIRNDEFLKLMKNRRRGMSWD